MPTDLESARRNMVESQLKGRGISDLKVLDAFLRVPRHEFVQPRFRSQAYRDSPLPIGEGQTISQPYMVAVMTETADVHPGLRILEVGTGSGYQAAILAEMGADVFSVERIPLLAERARVLLEALGYHVAIRVGDGTLGWPEEAPFDRILVTAGAPDVPTPLIEQLSLNGSVIIPVDDGFSQVLSIVRKTDRGVIEERRERCTFVPLIGQYGWKGP
ncbi:MAG: protein-L-isoaspartate(D-aspartate) O-methyltransferase [Acidobacteriota bacterium]|jgi:protein-L-isoaspartate(D-aspartate) O-methyltransferase